MTSPYYKVPKDLSSLYPPEANLRPPHGPAVNPLLNIRDVVTTTPAPKSLSDVAASLSARISSLDLAIAGLAEVADKLLGPASGDAEDRNPPRGTPVVGLLGELDALGETLGARIGVLHHGIQRLRSL